ncbi:pectinesterase inhibitor-like [Magnolia sinica]|uniref:pectinesterase inhibitor-like n=1 Tax=Magnolia sinica TaxID=86752 RepID=UPI00265B307F|nr:pectinesterase inhibitor-like [Magnolia sinica]
MSSLLLKFLVVVVVLFSVYQSTAATLRPGRDQTLIRKTCKKTRNYNQCVKSLKDDRRSYDATDAPELAKIAIEHALANANHLYKQTNALRKKTGYDDKTIRAMETCSKIYGEAIDSLMQATQAIGAKDYKSANLYTSEVIDAADTCSQEFRESARKMPFARRNGILNDLAVIALDLVAHL